MSADRSEPNSNRRLHSQNLRIPYYNPLVLPDLTASVDNVRIKYTYRKKFYDFSSGQPFDSLSYLFGELTSSSLFCEFPVDFYHREVNFRLGCYSHTVVYSLPDGGSFAVMLGRYTMSTSDKGLAPECVIDFNPNKVMGRFLRRIMGILYSISLDVEIMRFDLALDFPVERDSLSLVRKAGSGYQKFVDRHGIITEYTGKRSHHGAVKLYDKGAEVGLASPLCRLELTIEWSKYCSVIPLIPSILSSAPLEFSMGFNDLPFPVKAVLIHPDLYDVLKKSVAPNTWTKYKSALCNSGQVYFSIPHDALQKVDDYVYKYVVGLPQIHLNGDVS